MLDVARARRETPGCEKVLHFNNAGASLAPNLVLETVINHLRLEAEIGGYEAAERADERLEHVYDAIARLIGCQRDEIAVVENATRAWDMAFYSFPFRPGDRILSARAEYASNYIAYLQIARRTGVLIEPIPNDEHGQVSTAALRGMIDDKVKLIAITHVPTNGGLVNPAAEVGKVARAAGIPYLLDACQSVGQMPVNVEEIGCDMLSATGRKYLRGPRATGFLYVRSELLGKLEPPFLDLHAALWSAPGRYEIRPDARRFETWETNGATKLGLGAAIDYALSYGMEAIWQRVSSLASYFRVQLGQISHAQIHDLGQVRCGIVSFTIQGKSAAEVKHKLRAENMNVSISPREYTRLDMEARGLEEVVRASVHYYNTEEEVDRFCAALRSMV